MWHQGASRGCRGCQGDWRLSEDVGVSGVHGGWPGV